MPTYKLTVRKVMTFETVIEADTEWEALDIHDNECDFDEETASNIQWSEVHIEEAN